MTSQPLPLAIPGVHRVRAALRVVEIVDLRGETRDSLDTAYSLYPSDGIFSTEDLRSGEELLRSCRLLEVSDGRVQLTGEAWDLSALDERRAIAVLLDRLLTRASPPWLSSVVGDSVRWEYMPEAVHEGLSRILSDPEEREEFLLNLGRRFESRLRVELGDAGEELVFSRCVEYLHEAGHPALAQGVRRVSRVSDQLGYDIVTPNVEGLAVRLEVKAQGRRRADFVQVYLSRNEVEQGRRDRRWVLVVCEPVSDSELAIAGWCRLSGFERVFPVDRSFEATEARWKTVELRFERARLTPGLPLAPGLLNG